MSRIARHFSKKLLPDRVTLETLEGMELLDLLERRAQLETLVLLDPLDPVVWLAKGERGDCKDPLEMMDVKEPMEHGEAPV